MAKPSAFVVKMQAEAKREIRKQRLFTLQQCEDIMLIMLGREFQFGPIRGKKAREAYREVFREYCAEAIADDRDDPQLNYTKGCMDRELEKILGDEFVPWEARYPEEIFGK